MKKILSIFILIFTLFFVAFPNSYAKSYTESEMIEVVKKIEFDSVNATVLFMNWSSNYVTSVEKIIDKEFVDKLNTSDVALTIDIIVNELREHNEDYAANELAAIKNDLIYCYNSIINNMNILEEYLINNDSYNVIENSDLFIQLKNAMKNLKPYASEVIDIYYNEFYGSFKEKISSYNTVSDIISLYNEGLNKIRALQKLFNKFESSINNWQNIYNLYNLSDFGDLFDDYFGNITDKIRTEYNKIYKNFEQKMQENLDKKIEDIVQNTDTSSYESVINRNLGLYDIIDYINKVKDDANEKFDEVTLLIKIQELSEKVISQKSKIINRFVEAVKYTEQYIIQTSTIVLKNEADKSYINIDPLNKLIIYNQTNLDIIKFIERLFTSFGNIKIENTYSNKIGTLSKIRLYYGDRIVEDYTLIVKGDIAPNAAFDITDVVKICNKMFNKIDFDQYANIAADMNGDNKIDITDVVMLCNLLFK